MASTTYAPQTLTHIDPSGVARDYRPNKFGNKCAGCGVYVPGGQGELTGSKQAGWKVQHLPGMCPEQPASAPAPPAKPYQPPAPKVVQVTVGVFKYEGDIYVVKPAKGATRLYAWRLVESPPRVTLAGTVIPFRLVKSYGAIYKLTEAMRLTMADANEISELYGKCICCARALYAADTILKCKQTGIWVGPDCRDTYFPASV